MFFQKEKQKKNWYKWLIVTIPITWLMKKMCKNSEDSDDK